MRDDAGPGEAFWPEQEKLPGDLTLAVPRPIAGPADTSVLPLPPAGATQQDAPWSRAEDPDPGMPDPWERS